MGLDLKKLLLPWMKGGSQILEVRGAVVPSGTPEGVMCSVGFNGWDAGDMAVLLAGFTVIGAGDIPAYNVPSFPIVSTDDGATWHYIAESEGGGALQYTAQNSDAGGGADVIAVVAALTSATKPKLGVYAVGGGNVPQPGYALALRIRGGTSPCVVGELVGG